MLRKALMIAAALGATAAAAGALIVALAYALFAVLQTPLGSAGASACVAGAAAVLIGLTALIAVRSSGATKKKKPAPAASGNLSQTLIDLFKDKPFVASGVAAAAAALTLIKPEIIGVILRTVLNARGPAAPEKRRPKG